MHCISFKSQGKITLTTNHKHHLCESVQKGSTEHGEVRLKASTRNAHRKDLQLQKPHHQRHSGLPGSQRSRAITQLLGQLHNSSVNPPDVLLPARHCAAMGGRPWCQDRRGSCPREAYILVGKNRFLKIHVNRQVKRGQVLICGAKVAKGWGRK